MLLEWQTISNPDYKLWSDTYMAPTPVSNPDYKLWSDTYMAPTPV